MHMLENSSRILSLSAAAILSLSVAYDWAYFQVVQPKFFPLLTPGDHLAAALERLPLTVGIWLIGIGISFLQSHRERMTEPKSDGADTSGSLFSPLILLLLLVATTFSGVFFTREPAAMLLFGIAFIAPYAILYGLHWAKVRCSRAIVSLMVYGTAAVFLVLAWGAKHGSQDVRAKQGHFLLIFKDGRRIPDVIILRHGQQGAMVRVPSAGIEMLVHWDEIAMIEHSPNRDHRPYACQWVGWNCPAIEAPTPS